MSSPPVSINYGAFLGISSVPAAVIFTVIYAPFALLFLVKAFRKFNFVYVFIQIFCAVRVVAFAIRAVIAGSDSAGQNLGLTIADLILFGVGFTGLLFSAFSLQLDRERIAGLHHRSPVLRLVGNKRVFHLIIVVAVALTITGTTKFLSDSADERNTGNTLRRAGTWIILALAVLQLLRTLAFVWYEFSGTRSEAVSPKSAFGNTHSGLILSAISGLLVIRMIYAVVTISKQQHEAAWYPLTALTEFLCVCLFAVPGLVLSRAELREKDIELNGYHHNQAVTPNYA